VYVIGEQGILEELDLKGIAHMGGPEDADKKVKLAKGEFMEHDHDVRPDTGWHELLSALLVLTDLACRTRCTRWWAVTHITPHVVWAGTSLLPTTYLPSACQYNNPSL
jgi:phosphoglycolate phosphatase